MPYEKLADLPDSVKDNLPKQAQEIYLAAFNNAWDRYKSPEDRSGDDDRETVAHRPGKAVKPNPARGPAWYTRQRMPRAFFTIS